MKSFLYIVAYSVQEACSLAAQYGSDARILAGGTDLLIEMRRSSAKVPKIVIDISRVNELRGIVESGDGIIVKPLTTHARLLNSGLLRERASLLASAASTIGSPQIRNRGTIGGNVMNASPCADTVPPLVALDATITLQSNDGVRTVPLSDFFHKPYKTKANAAEILVDIRFRKLPSNSKGAFIKLGRRNALSVARLSVAAVVQQEANGSITDARIVPGSAFPVWRRAAKAEQLLIGQKPSEELFAEAGKEVSAEMIRETGRRWSTEYKEPVVAALVRTALEHCANARPHALPGLVPSTAKIFRSDAKAGVKVADVCTITATINGRRRLLTVSSGSTLLHLLRDGLGLTGTKCGCEVGECGACTVQVDGEAVNSCLVLAPQIDGRDVMTVEGLAKNGVLHPLQESFMENDAVHCGFCTPGMLMSAMTLLDGNDNPREDDIRTAISGNLCRCTGYIQIVDAIRAASRQQNPALGERSIQKQ